MECDLVMLDTAHYFQHPVWGIGAVLGLEAHPKDTEQYQGKEAMNRPVFSGGQILRGL